MLYCFREIKEIIIIPLSPASTGGEILVIWTKFSVQWSERPRWSGGTNPLITLQLYILQSDKTSDEREVLPIHGINCHCKHFLPQHRGPNMTLTHYYRVLNSSGYYSYSGWLDRFPGVVKP